jgi:uncharacterized protein
MGNHIVHIEFPAGDPAGAGAFYNQLFGWETTPMSEGYVLFNPGEGAVGGGFSKPEGPSPNWVVCYIQVDDIEAHLAKIAAAGGSMVVPKTKISDEHGFFALFKDPQGNIAGLWSQT